MASSPRNFALLTFGTMQAFTGAVPFKDLSAPVAMVTVMQGDRPLRPEYPTFTENLWTLMKRCWDQDPRLRPNISQVLQVLPTPSVPYSLWRCIH